MTAEVEQIPFMRDRPAERYLTAVLIDEFPWVRDLVKRFPHCFVYSPHRDAYVFVEK